jgi:exodeoxyribonuclease V beta subunit
MSAPDEEPPLACRIELGGAGTQLIEASAGTGKTWTLALLYARLVAECGLLPESILAVTFTRAATAELRERVQRVLRGLGRMLDEGLQTAVEGARLQPDRAQARYGGEALALARRLLQRGAHEPAAAARVRRALAAMDHAAIHTIHGFAERLLAESPLSARAAPAAELVFDLGPWLEQIAADFWRREVAAGAGLLAHPGLESAAALADLASDPVLRTPSALAAWLRRALRSEAEPVLLDDPRARLGLEQAAADWHAARGRAVEACRDALDAYDGAALAAAIGALPFVERRSYRADWVSSWLDQLRQWLTLALDDPLAEPPKALTRMLPATLGGESAERAAAVRAAHLWFGRLEQADQGCRNLAQACARLCARLRLAAWHHAQRELPLRLQRARCRSAEQTLRDLAALADAGAGDHASKQGWRAAQQQRFRACLVDEFQDTDAAQWALFNGLFGDPGWQGDLLLVGDPKQAIYRFRGADLAVYLRARRAVPQAARHALTRNFRSVEPLLRALNRLHEQAPDYGDADIAYQPVQSARGAAGEAGPLPEGLCLLPFSSQAGNADQAEADAAAAAARWIARACAAGAPAAAFAVLVYDHGQARLVQRALARLGLASARRDKASVFHGDEAADLLVLLGALSSGDAPGRAAAERRALLSPLLGSQAAGAAQPEAGDDGAAGAVLQTAPAFERWRALEQRGGAAAAVARALYEHGRLDRAAPGAEGAERALTNLRHLLELMPSGPARQAERWLARARSARAAAGGEGHLLRLESDANVITISTIHAAKGLEFRHVVLPFAWRHAEPKPGGDPLLIDADDGQRRLYIGEPDDDAGAQLQRELRAEAERLNYVALTRARDTLVVLWPDTRGGGNDKWPSQAAKSPFGTMLLALDDEARRQAGIVLLDAESDAKAVPKQAPTAVEPAASPLADKVGVLQVAPAYSVSSFSALHRAASVSAAEPLQPLRIGQDHDSNVDSIDETVVTISPAAQSLQGVLDWKLGRDGGSVMHELLEHIDFADPSTWDPPLERAAQGLGLQARQRPTLRAWLEAIVTQPLPMLPGAPCLRDLPRRRQQREWSFSLAHDRLDAAALDRALSAHGLAQAPQLEGQRGLPAGYLDGVVDLLFEHQGRIWILDYKTNRLGSTAADYAPARLDAAMQQHAYGLQAALYALAAARALRLRRPGFDAGRDVGGVIYFFVRAAALDAADRPPLAGLWHRPVGPALLHALEAALPFTPKMLGEGVR